MTPEKLQQKLVALIAAADRLKRRNVEDGVDWINTIYYLKVAQQSLDARS